MSGKRYTFTQDDLTALGRQLMEIERRHEKYAKSKSRGAQVTYSRGFVDGAGWACAAINEWLAGLGVKP